MKHQNKLTSRQQAEEQLQAAAAQQTHETTGREFANAEEMLRHDALHTPVPPAVAQRLAESLGKLPPPSGRSAWWRRWFGP